MLYIDAVVLLILLFVYLFVQLDLMAKDLGNLKPKSGTNIPVS